MRVSFYTLGCKLNRAETDELKRALSRRGFAAVPFDSGEDIAVIRACGVTMGASRTTRELIRAAKRRGAYVVATGCLENQTLPEIDFVAKNNEDIIRHLLTAVPPPGENNLCPPPAPAAIGGTDGNKDKTRAFVKIQTGCNFNCAYCIIPSFRGRSQSLPAEEIITRIKILEKENFKEAVLTGVNICLYRDGRLDLAGLLKKILKETKIERLRLGSLDPRLVSDRLIDLYKNERLLPHMHMSLQSGSDAVLLGMRRGYTAKNYLDLVRKIRALYPRFSFTTDVIVGFPGETEKNFLETCAFVKKIGFAKVHVFPFSPRPGTPAGTMINAMQDKIKTERVKKLIKLAAAVGKKYARQFLGQTRPVLFENQTADQQKSGYWYGYTPEYVRIKHHSAKNLENKIVEVRIKQLSF